MDCFFAQVQLEATGSYKWLWKIIEWGGGNFFQEQEQILAKKMHTHTLKCFAFLCTDTHCVEVSSRHTCRAGWENGELLLCIGSDEGGADFITAIRVREAHICCTFAHLSGQHEATLKKKLLNDHKHFYENCLLIINWDHGSIKIFGLLVKK